MYVWWRERLEVPDDGGHVLHYRHVWVENVDGAAGVADVVWCNNNLRAPLAELEE